ncbi:MAG: hypothetical protein MK101_08060 [Phycisphaerales bacterium]|nr:hypothetical protein [Phycisphaerales bacterium]
MSIRSFAVSASLGCALLVLTPVSASATSMPAAPQNGPASLGSEQTHLIALEDMTASTNSTLSQSLDREKRMRSYIEENGMGQAFDAFKGSGTHDMAMTFEEALHQAILNVQAHSAAGSGDSGDLTRKIKAYTDLARTSWDQLQASMSAVQRMHDFLQSQGKVDAYMGWAHDKATAEHKAILAKGEVAAKAARTKEAHLQKVVQERHKQWLKDMAKQRQQRLKWNWDVYKFNAEHGLTRTQLNMINDPYSGYRQYGDSYYDGGGWGLSSTGAIEPYGTTVTR